MIDSTVVPPLMFADLALSPEVQKVISSIGYEKPTPIQAQAIPHLLEGRDILGVAQTGTGKQLLLLCLYFHRSILEKRSRRYWC